MKRLILLVAIAGCTEDATPPITAVMIASDAPPAYGQTPFPTDALRDGSTLGDIAGLDAIAGLNVEPVVQHASALDGFGLRPLVEIFVDGPLDPASIPAFTDTLDAACVLIELDPATLVARRAIGMDWRYDATRGVIAGSPAFGLPLREGVPHAAIVTTGVRTADGTPLARGADLDRILRDPPARWRTTAAAYAALALDDCVAGLAVFTTQHASQPMVIAREALDRAPAVTVAFDQPSLVFAGTAALDRVLGVATRATDGPRAGLERWGNDNPTGIAHAHVGVVGTGRMTVPRFRNDDTGTDGPEDEAFVFEAGQPRIFAMESIPITFILPAAPPPPAGYPVVMYGHGLGAGRDQMLSFAEPLTARGFAVVGIDMAGHGSRFDPTDLRPNMAAQLAAFSGDPTLPDGFGDNTGLSSTFEFFEGFRGIAAVRDGIRQSALDLSRVVALVRSFPDLTALAGPGGVPRLDPEHIAYLGESFGTVVGTVFAAVEPNVDLYVLDVPGGGVLDKIMPTSAEIGALALPFVRLVYNPRQPLDRWSPLIGLMQAVIDGADPLTYAPHVIFHLQRGPLEINGAPIGFRHVVAIEVVGDQVLSNAGTDALVQAMSLSVLEPNLYLPPQVDSVASPTAGNRGPTTAVLVQYAPATHGANWSSEHGTLRYSPEPDPTGDLPYPLLPAPITIDNPLYQTLDQVLEVLETHLTGDAPTVRSTLAPVRDFDGDGRPDADDPAPYDPAR